MTPSAPGEFLGNDRFTVLRRLGEGGFGVVYEVLDRQRNARVALKTLRRVDPAALYRFKQEFRFFADLAHSNLVMLYELLSDGEQWFFTMELLDGLNLLDYLREQPAPAPRPVPPSVSEPSGPPWTEEDVTRSLADAGAAPSRGVIESLPLPDHAVHPERVREVFQQLAGGVIALHEAEMLHRDIKPSNVLVTRDGRVVLLDFGLAAELVPGGGAEAGQIAGTPAYMAPELLSGSGATPATDWYAVGVVLYQALTGRTPFSGTLVKVLWDKQNRDPVEPAQLADGVPEDLNALCLALLDRDPSRRPCGPEILRRLGHGGGAAVVRRRRLLVGRRRHLAALDQAWETVRQGRPAVVYLHGRSGMGKSVLVRRFLDLVEQREPGAVVLKGRCYERESVPYKALDSLVDALTRYLKRLPGEELEPLLPDGIHALARLFPVLEELDLSPVRGRDLLQIPDIQQIRRLAQAALRELVERLARRAQLVLFIDDVQWGDLDSGALIEELLRPPDPPPLLLLACYRSEEAEASPLVPVLRASTAGSACEIEVGELTPAEARELALALVGDESPARAEAIARESGGSPFFVEELARAEPEEALAAGSTLDGVLHLRICRLPEPVRRFLEIVAVAGQPVERQVVREAAEASGDEQAVLGILRAGQLVRTRGSERVEPYHDRIRETVVAHLAVDQLRSHHSRLARAHEASGRADPEALSVHFHGAGELGRAAHYAVAAADQAAQALAFDRAARLFRQALEWRPLSSAEAAPLRVKLAEALANAGRGAEAAHTYLSAVPAADPSQRLDLNRRAAEQFLMSGHLQDGLDALRAVLKIVGMALPKTPARAVFWLLLRRAYLKLRGLGFRERPASEVSPVLLSRIDTGWSVATGLGMVDVFLGSEFQSRHLLLALRAGEPYRVARALALETGYWSLPGTRVRPRIEALIRKTMELADRVGNPHILGLSRITSGIALHAMGLFPESFEHLDRGLTILRERCTGVAWEIDTGLLFWLDDLFWLGEWKELARHAPVVHKEARDRNDIYVTGYTMGLHAVYLAADDPRRAREEADRGRAGWEQDRFLMQHFWDMYAQHEIDLYAGDAAGAWQRMRRTWPRYRRSLMSQIQLVHIETLHLRSRCALALAAQSAGSDQERLLRQTQRDAARIERQRTAWGDALATLLRAGVASAHGKRQEAVHLLAEAEKGFAAVRMSQYAAATRRRRGELLGGDEGRLLIETADAWMAGQDIRNPARVTAMLAPLRS